MVKMTFTLPDDYSLEIGRIITKWAYLENYLQRCVHLMMGVDDVVGRVALKETRVPERVKLIEEIAYLRGFSLEKKIMKSTRKMVEEVYGWRNLIAHGLWVELPEHGWCVRQTKGKLPQEAKLEGLAQNRKITPEAVPVSLELLRNISENTGIMIKNAQAMQDALTEMITQQMNEERG